MCVQVVCIYTDSQYESLWKQNIFLGTQTIIIPSSEKMNKNDVCMVEATQMAFEMLNKIALIDTILCAVQMKLFNRN